MRRGAQVRFKQPTKPPKRSATGQAEVNVIPGVWYTIEQSGGRANGWWLMPSDGMAKAWATGHPTQLVSGCLEAGAHQIELSFHVS